MKFDKLSAFAFIIGYFVFAGTLFPRGSFLSTIVWGNVGLIGTLLFGFLGGRR